MKNSRRLLIPSLMAVLVGTSTIGIADMGEMPMGKEPDPAVDSSAEQSQHTKMQGHDKMMKDHDTMMSKHQKSMHDHNKMKMKKNMQDPDQQQMKDQAPDKMKPDADPNGMSKGGMNDM